MTAPPAAAFTLTDDELRAVGARVGVTDFPTVLALRPRHGDVESLDRATECAVQRLTAGRLITDGAVHQELAAMTQALRRPARSLALRLVTPDGTARVIVVPHGSGWVLARRVGNEIALREGGQRCGLDGAVRLLLSELPVAAPLAVDPFGAPTAALAECLTGTHAMSAIADRLRALGAAAQVATALGAAFAARQAFAEIVCHWLNSESDRIVTAPAAVAVFYTGRGRLVAAPSMSPAGQLWTTLKPGSDHRVAQAVSQLAEFAPKGWEEGIQ
ncbi:ESX secretion-associated protein EspG [Mycobacterium sp. CPCC 205372]|uniref:ESX secretion-associated protein EspG n=1 Tax=Mycobacterium hippophais TaxID=3016340 RepID=A0ABT4PUD2_9MYCO|nr:ESX secretion-associated protein EspG [Mycobacterium hippophais]MCZ8380192.1 ESX secretion-associated protein EspG [Mycobacterium hippophais]